MNVETNRPAAENGPEFRLGGRRARVMAQSVVLDEEGNPRLFRKAGATIAVAVLGLLAWAGFLHVDRTVTFSGVVVPAGETKVVRHADGGTVAEVLVKNGDRVEEGQILMRLTSDALRDDLKKIKARRAGVGMLAAELKSLASDKEPDFSFALPEHKDLVDKERVVYRGLKNLTDKNRDVIEDEIKKLTAQLDDIAKRKEALSKNTDILEEELQFREDLFKKGLTDKGVYAETKNQVEKAYKGLADLTAQHQRVNKALTAARRRLAAFTVRMRGHVMTEMLAVNPMLDILNEKTRNLEERVARLTVSAPAGGVVRAAEIPAVGARVAANATIMQIVPLGGESAVEARIPATDLARVKVGMPVTVKVTSGASARYAGIRGELTEISTTPSTDDKGRSYHKATITIAGEPLKPVPAHQRLTPGATVEATAKIASRPLYAELWRRITGRD